MTGERAPRIATFLNLLQLEFTWKRTCICQANLYFRVRLPAERMADPSRLRASRSMTRPMW